MKFTIEERYRPLIKEWVDALRSGTYHQGQHALYHPPTDDEPETYCCLGVLCSLKISLPSTFESRQDEDEDFEDESLGLPADILGDDELPRDLYESVVETVVETSKAGSWRNSLAHHLAGLNDHSHGPLSEEQKEFLGDYPVKEKYDFNDIANLIELSIQYVPDKSAPELGTVSGI